jgi:hypothetical protein
MYTQLVDSPTQGDALLNIYFVLPESSFTSCSMVQEISDQCEVLLDVEWGKNYCRPQVERLDPVEPKREARRTGEVAPSALASALALSEGTP